MNGIDEFVTLCSAHAEGPMDDAKVVAALARCWDDLRGSGAGAMTAAKIQVDRLESVIWSPPLFRFQIERHGGTVNGSTRAIVQSWVVDTEKCAANIEAERRRQLYKTAARLDIKPLADEIASLVCSTSDDRRIKRLPDGSVKIQIGNVIPSDGFARTISGRRKRFGCALNTILQQRGWTLEGWLARRRP